MSGWQILILSSDAGHVRPVADALRASGHQVVLQDNPAAAAAEVSAGGVDSLLVDLHCPGCDPLTLARALTPPDDPGPPEPLEAVERHHILLALRHTHGNKRRAAQLLGIARSTLIQKVRRYDIRLDNGSSD